METSVVVSIKNIKGEFKPLNLFQYFDDGIRKRLPKNLAKEVYEQLIRNIETNRYKFQLSKDWVDHKKQVGAEEKPFMMFGYYKNAIQIITSDGHLSIGFKKTTIHPRAKIPISNLAVALEFGDLAKGRPARPLWRNTMDDFAKEKGLVNEIFRKSIEGK